MKKLIVLATLSMGLLFNIPSFALQNRPIEIIVRDKVVYFTREPTIKDGTLMVPAGKLVDVLQGDHSWDNDTGKLTVKKEQNTWLFQIGKKFVKKNGRVRRLKEPLYLDKGMVMIPMRYLAMQFNEKLQWDSRNQRVIVSTNRFPENQDNFDKNRVVVIDPGHGGKESGAVYEGVKEKDLNLKIAKLLQRQLEAEGIKVYMTREEDKYVGLYERSAFAERVGADILVSVHNNAGHKNSRGSMTLYYPSKTIKTGNLQPKDLANSIQRFLTSSLNMKDWGIIERPNLAVLRTATVPAVIAEVGFMSNGEELKQLKSRTFQERAALSIKHGILEALSKI